MALEHFYLKHSNLWTRDKKHSKATKGKQQGGRARWRKQRVVNSECMRETLLVQLLHPHDPTPSQLLPVSAVLNPSPWDQCGPGHAGPPHACWTSSHQQHGHKQRWFVELKKQREAEFLTHWSHLGPGAAFLLFLLQLQREPRGARFWILAAGASSAFRVKWLHNSTSSPSP